MRLFNIDSPLMQALGKMADLLWLNVLTLICCIPIVTVGASLTAMNYVALKIARNEECYITKDFFKSFRQNLKQATVIWLLLLLLILVLAGDFYIISNSDITFGNVIRIAITVLAVAVLFTAIHVFPMLAKFDNTTPNTIKNAFFMSILQFPKTLLMIVFYILPPVVFVFFTQIAPIPVLFCLSVPAWLSAKLYSGFFQKLEDQILAEAEPTEEEGEDERIFRDELDESLFDGDSNK